MVRVKDVFWKVKLELLKFSLIKVSRINTSRSDMSLSTNKSANIPHHVDDQERTVIKKQHSHDGS